jgi:enediyne biosynthesis thioesterase
MLTQLEVQREQCRHGRSGEPYFAYRRVVLLEETNSTGNTYFSQYVKWQGYCREMFLKLTADWVIRELGTSYALVTTTCHVDYYAETQAFDDVCIHLWFSEVAQNRMSLEFEYWRIGEAEDEYVARGSQQLAWLERCDDGRWHPRRVPSALLTAIDRYIALKYDNRVRA